MRRLEHKKDTLKWHRRYIELAALVGGWSKHPDFQVGAVAVGDFGQIMSTGYNGWPRGMVNEEQGRKSTNDKGYSNSIHAETNLIYNANLTGVTLRGCTVYVHPVLPCFECAKALVQVGVNAVYYKRDKASNYNDWTKSWSLAKELFKEAGVTLRDIDA